MIEVSTEVELTPSQLAEEFWNMDDTQQSEFFNKLGDIVKNAQGRGLFQLDYIVLSGALRDSGRWVIDRIHNSLEESSIV